MDRTNESQAKDPAKAPPVATSRRRRWLRRGLIGAGVALVLFTIVGFFVVPPVARRVAQTQLGTLLGRKVVIDRIRLNPFALSLTIEGVHVFEADAQTPFVEFRRFYANAQLSSVYRRAPVVKEISLDGLRIHVEHRTATPAGWGDLTTYNFSDILARLTAGPPAPPAPPAPADAAPPRFSVNNIRLTDGKLVFEDRPLGARHEISDLSIGIPFVSTLPVFIDSFVEPGLSVRVDGTPFVAQGRSKPFKDSQETTLELRLQALDVTRYVPFVPMDLPFTVDSARLTVALDLAFVRPRVDAPSLSVKGRIALGELTVREKRGAKAEPLPLLKLGELEVAIADANLTTQRLHVSQVRLTGLEVHARRHRNGVLNLQQMAPRAPASDAAPPAKVAQAAKTPKSAASKAEPPPRFVVDAIDLTGIKVHLDDQTTTPSFHATVDETSLVVRGLSNTPGTSATVAFGARAVPGGVIKQNGTLRLEPHLRAKGSLTVDGIEPGRFAPYYAEQIAFDIIKGKVRVGSAYDVDDSAGTMAVKLEQAFVELTDFALRRREKRDDFLRTGLIAVRGAKIDLAARQVSIGEVTLTEGRLRAERDEKGVVDLSTLAGASTPPPVAKVSARPAPAAPPDAARPAWSVTVAKLDIDKWGVRFDDRAVQPRAQLSVDPLSLHLTDISTAPGARMGVNLRMGLNRTATLTVTGTGGYQPVVANLRYDLKGLDLVPLQPYFKDQVSLDVTGGALSLKGQANVEVPAAPAHGGAARPPKAAVEADLEIAGFASVDRARQESLVQWKSFRVTGVKLATPPMALRIGEIGLDDLQARVALLPAGGTNLAHAFAPAAPPATARTKTPVPPPAVASRPAQEAKPAVEERPPQVDVGQVLIQRGVVLFSDRTVQPNVSTEITDFGGRISGLSSTADTQANIDLHAAVNRGGSLTITGQANPLAKDLFAEVKVDIKDVDLPPASPYAGRYVGYAVEKGKLGVSLAYHVANRKLEASNRLVLDQFTFGGKTDSAEAVNVPVRLAVAILKDRHGVIDLELPIAGSLDDPEFKVGRLILKVLGNLVVKAVTAPFSYIASAFGGGDELSRLDFAPGSIALESKTQQKLTSLTKALTERPGLSFEVEGFADPRRDRESVRRQVLERLLAAERVAELQAAAGDSGKVVPAIDNVRVAAADRPRLLEKLYQARTAAKPPAGPKPASPVELEKALFEQVSVSDDELRALALRRATLVQATLSKSVAGAGARLFLLKPRLDAAGARVDFHLKQD